jgi:hypothetical protein
MMRRRKKVFCEYLFGPFCLIPAWFFDFRIFLKVFACSCWVNGEMVCYLTESTMNEFFLMLSQRRTNVGERSAGVKSFKIFHVDPRLWFTIKKLRKNKSYLCTFQANFASLNLTIVPPKNKIRVSILSLQRICKPRLKLRENLYFMYVHCTRQRLKNFTSGYLRSRGGTWYQVRGPMFMFAAIFSSPSSSYTCKTTWFSVKTCLLFYCYSKWKYVFGFDFKILGINVS